MKILSAEQIRDLDQYTITHEPVSSIDLMERVAGKLYEALSPLIKTSDRVFVFCGMGNNGGDGLALARLLINSGYGHVSVLVVRHSPQPSKDFTENEYRLKNISGIHYIETEQQIPNIAADSVVIDAILGSGLTRNVEGIAAAVIQTINAAKTIVYSVDIPSGLFCDQPNQEGDIVIHAQITFTFHAPKLNFLLPESGKYVPEFRVLDIGLVKEYAEQLPSDNYFLTSGIVRSIVKQREKFSHKGTYGHALLAVGSHGKIGAAVLAAKAALRSGAGLVSVHVPGCGYTILQTTTPEAMIVTDTSQEHLTTIPDLTGFSTVGVGPGIGTGNATANYLKDLFLNFRNPVVIDADGLNIVALHPDLLKLIPIQSVLTPHPGEFKRLAGDWGNSWERLEKQKEFAAVNNVVLILKGAHTSVALPDGKIYFNSTGNAGMAKGGSGDVLTGVVTSFLAQKYSPEEAALLGVYLHGLAGDMAREHYGSDAMQASDIIRYLPQAFKVTAEK